MRARVKAAGGIWRPRHRLWELDWKSVRELGIEDRVVDFFAGLGSPNENAPIERGDDAFVALGKIDWHLSNEHLATLRYTYTWSEQPNGTFDVDSWGVSANAVEEFFDLGDALIASLGHNVCCPKFQCERLAVRMPRHRDDSGGS